MTTQEKNEVIAKWMGGKDAEDVGNPYKYHEFWDVLMPVVEKIEQADVLGYKFEVDITAKHVIICSWVRRTGMKPIRFSGTAETKIEATLKAVIQFIEWHNANVKQS